MHALRTSSVPTGAWLAAVPTMLFALNGFGQAAYLVGDGHDRTRRVRLVVFGTFLLAVLVEGIPLAVLSLTAPPGTPFSGDFPLLGVLHAMDVAPYVVTLVRVGIVFALANALLATLHLGGRLLLPLTLPRRARPVTPRPPTAISDSAAVRRRTLLLGTAMVLVAALPPATLTIGAGQSIVGVNAFVAAAAARVATSPARRAVAVVQVVLMAVLLGWGLTKQPAQVASTLAALTLGVAVGAVRARRRRAG